MDANEAIETLADFIDATVGRPLGQPRKALNVLAVAVDRALYERLQKREVTTTTAPDRSEPPAWFAKMYTQHVPPPWLDSVRAALDTIDHSEAGSPAHREAVAALWTITAPAEARAKAESERANRLYARAEEQRAEANKWWGEACAAKDERNAAQERAEQAERERDDARKAGYDEATEHAAMWCADHVGPDAARSLRRGAHRRHPEPTPKGPEPDDGRCRSEYMGHRCVHHEQGHPPKCYAAIDNMPVHWTRTFPPTEPSPMGGTPGENDAQEMVLAHVSDGDLLRRAREEAHDTGEGCHPAIAAELGRRGLVEWSSDDEDTGKLTAKGRAAIAATEPTAAPTEPCSLCNDTGVVHHDTTDLPCPCPAGATTNPGTVLGAAAARCYDTNRRMRPLLDEHQTAPTEPEPDTATCDGCSLPKPLDRVHFGEDAITCDECSAKLAAETPVAAPAGFRLFLEVGRGWCAMVQDEDGRSYFPTREWAADECRRLHSAPAAAAPQGAGPGHWSALVTALDEHGVTVREPSDVLAVLHRLTGALKANGTHSEAMAAWEGRAAPSAPQGAEWDPRTDGTALQWVRSVAPWPRSITRTEARRLHLSAWRAGVLWAVANPDEAKDYGPETVPLSLGADPSAPQAETDDNSPSYEDGRRDGYEAADRDYLRGRAEGYEVACVRVWKSGDHELAAALRSVSVESRDSAMPGTSAPQGGPARDGVEKARAFALAHGVPMPSAEMIEHWYARRGAAWVEPASPPHGERPEPGPSMHHCRGCDAMTDMVDAADDEPRCKRCGGETRKPAPAYVPKVGDEVEYTRRGTVSHVWPEGWGGAAPAYATVRRDPKGSGESVLWTELRPVRPTSDEPGWPCEHDRCATYGRCMMGDDPGEVGGHG